MKLSSTLWVLLALLTHLATSTANEPSLKDARRHWLRGEQDVARAQYEELAKIPANRSAATIGLSRSWQTDGKYDKALAVVDAALVDRAGDADLHARRAEVLYLRGRWPDAEAAATAALKLKPDHLLARWVRARVWWDRGDLKQADTEFRWFVRTYAARDDADDPIKDPDELLLVGLAGWENARWHRLPDQFGFILKEVFGDAGKNDTNYWPAEYQAGMMLLEKYNRGEALAAFDKVLTINPNAAEALVGKGIAALQKLELKDAEQFATAALKLNPRLPEALRLSADIALASSDQTTARQRLEAARTVNPRDERTLGRLAACALLDHDQKTFDTLVKEVEAHDSKPGVFYFEVAERLGDRRHFEPAEKYFKQALTLRPMLTAPRNELGLLYMRLGREPEARELLSQAFEADAFNVRVSNSLRVLKHLDKYETLKTEHFLIRFDPTGDRPLARYMAIYLEEIYRDLANRFHYHPPGPILVEVFNNHDMFSGRVVALPDLHTIGASTGRMFAMVSPNGKGIAHPFNWLRVIRHELVHIFNLEQTHFQVPHWLTEGLATANEGFPRPPAWNTLLLKRLAANDLLTLDNINLGFMRPRSPDEWNLAYCQSQLYVEYLISKYGAQVIGELLAAYGEGLDTPLALRKVCKVQITEIESGYRAYLEKLAASLKTGVAAGTEDKRTLKELQDAHEKTPDDLEVSLLLADQYLNRDRNAEARKLVEAVLTKDAAQPRGLAVKARLLMKAGDDEAAGKLFETAAASPTAPPAVLKQYAKYCLEAKNYTLAAELLERGRTAEPFEPSWLTDLATTYEMAALPDKEIEVLQTLVPTDADVIAVRLKLARLLLEADKPADAEKYARQALEIDVRNKEARQLIDAALTKLNRVDEAKRLRTLLGE